MIVVIKQAGAWAGVIGNPTLTSLDGESRAPLRTILHESWTAQDRAAFGVFMVDTTPPEGKQWTYAFEDDDGVPVAVFEDIPPAPPPSVVSMRQARLALLGAGLLPQVEAAFDQMDEPERSAVIIEWEYATELRRDHPLVASLAAALGLTEQQVDDLFIAASQID